MPAPARDACPGLLALHPARDGYVARIRLPGGHATGPRWRALAALATDLGDGHLDLTSRGNVQLRGLRPADAGELSARAQQAGLLPSAAHDRARNIMASPLGNLRPLVTELDAALLGDPGLAVLPGRFLFSLDDGTGGAGLSGCDIGLLSGELVIAGRTAGVRGGADVAVAAARAAIAGGVGDRFSRVADLPDGGAAVAVALGGSLGAPAAKPDVRLPLGPSGPGPAERSSITMVAGARLGRLTVGSAGLVADLLAPGEVIRLGIAGRIVIPLAAGSSDAPVRLAAAGLLVADDDPLAGVTACSGTACRRAVADVRATAGPLPGHPRTHWAGCARQCGLPPDAEAVIAVDADRYQIAGRPLAGAR